MIIGWSHTSLPQTARLMPPLLLVTKSLLKRHMQDNLVIAT
ncbi:MAG: hypothetical protein ACRDSH_10295 [Pseudonocardiaceae bacterium]